MSTSDPAPTTSQVQPPDAAPVEQTNPQAPTVPATVDANQPGPISDSQLVDARHTAEQSPIVGVIPDDEVEDRDPAKELEAQLADFERQRQEQQALSHPDPQEEADEEAADQKAVDEDKARLQEDEDRAAKDKPADAPANPNPAPLPTS